MLGRLQVAVRPGMKCLYIDLVDQMLTWVEQFEDGLNYVECISFCMEVTINLRLIKTVFNWKGAPRSEQHSKEVFEGHKNDSGVEITKS